MTGWFQEAGVFRLIGKFLETVSSIFFNTKFNWASHTEGLPEGFGRLKFKR
jgi:hypothetical protein